MKINQITPFLTIVSILIPTKILLIAHYTEYFSVGPAFLSPIFEATTLILAVVILTAIITHVIAESI